MKHRFMSGFTISLKNRLALTYALFISLALGILILVINLFTGFIFTALIKDNIAAKSGEIVKTIGEQYNPKSGSFDRSTVEAMGMYFVHEGYVVTVEDEWNSLIWDARSCDMQECSAVLNRIALRMEEFRLNGATQKQRYPLTYLGKTIGTVTIETYGPFFFSETETQFLASINKLLLISGLVFIILSIGVSLLLARAIARPILQAGEAARRIAQACVPQKRTHSGGDYDRNFTIRLKDTYKTRELAGLSRSINELAETLEEGERRQKQLTADIAHELRTPLTCLQGNIEAMIDKVYKPDREHLESCHEEIIRLVNLIKDLDTLTGLEWEALSLHKTEFDLAKLIHVTAEQFGPAANEKGIAIGLNLRESPVKADYDRLKQVFINLLSNAVKYTDQGSITVTITEGESLLPVEASRRSQSRRASVAPLPSGLTWEIRIADTGIGIPENDLPHIFERFYRSDKSRGRGTGGAGIGLTIAAAIIRAHGGTISAENNNRDTGGAGSVFRLQVPGI